MPILPHWLSLLYYYYRWTSKNDQNFESLDEFYTFETCYENLSTDSTFGGHVGDDLEPWLMQKDSGLQESLFRGFSLSPHSLVTEFF